jgi:hypothetical protein
VTCLLCILAAPAAGQPPEPIDPTLFSFPGVVENPPSSASAGVALADQWLGDEPFGNPAARPRGQVALSPNVLRVSRQDLRADNRRYDEEPGFFEAAGASLGLPVPRGLGLWLYVGQPVLRLEDFAFNRGKGTDPTVAPAVVTGHAETREVRGGVAVSVPLQRLRAGVAIEWLKRRDLYRASVSSGAPDDGERQVEFDGDATGFQVGLRYDSKDSGTGKVSLGLGVRYLPALPMEGKQESDLLTGSNIAEVSVERESGWEGGVSARYDAVPALEVLAGVGHRTEQQWRGFGVSSGAATTWSLGVEYREPESPLLVRFGLGQEQQTGAPEPRAGRVGIGFAWDWDGTWIEVGAMRRSFERTDSPNSYDDRVVATVRVRF